MEAREAIYTATKALIDADTGTGGLKNSAFAGFLRGKNPVYAYDEHAAKLAKDVPNCGIRVDARDVSPCPNGAAVAGTDECFDSVVSLVLEDDRDPRSGTRIDRSAARARAILQNVVPTAIVDTDDATRKWYFTSYAGLEAPQPAPSGKRWVRVLNFRLFANKGTV